MRNLKITSQCSVLNIERESIIIGIIVGKSVILFNKKNQSFFYFFYATEESPKRIYFRHLVEGKSNLFCSGGFIVSSDGKTDELHCPGDSVNIQDGGIAACLKYTYLQELLESCFYVSGQERIYDFMKEEFLIPLP